MIGRALAFAALAGVVAAPCAAADLNLAADPAERRSGAAAGVYLAVPFGGERSGRAQGGLRLRMTHDYRDAAARPVRSASTDALELRLVGDSRPTLYVAQRPLTGRDARQNLFGGVVDLVVLGLAVVGAVVVFNALDGDSDSNCLDPDLCD